MQKYLYQLADMPNQKALMVGAVLAILYWLLLFDNGESMNVQFDTINQQIGVVQEDIKKAKAAQEDLNKFEEEMRQLSSQYSQIVEFMPQRMSTSELGSVLTEQANAAGLKVLEIGPAQSSGAVIGDNARFFETFLAQAKFEGRYMNIVGFLSQLSKIPRLITMDGMEMTLLKTGEPDNPMLEFKGIFVGYRYRLAGKDPNDPLGLKAVIEGAAQ